MNRLLLTAATVLTIISSNAAFAEGAKYTPWPGDISYKNEEVIVNPYDSGHLNESPIRGKGRFKVVHNAPGPDDTDRKLTEAMWLLKDNNYRCSRR